jgi:ClpX C4-type zinc finger
VPRTATVENVACSFCDKPENEVLRLVAGVDVRICDECVVLCTHILAEDLDLASVRESIASKPGALSDEAMLASMVRLHGSHADVDRATARHVQMLRQRGVTWARIGDALGMTRQSAWERFSGEE